MGKITSQQLEKLVLVKAVICDFLSLGKYLDKLDRVMTQVDRITEDIDQMPVAAFIFREMDEVHYSLKIRLDFSSKKQDLKKKLEKITDIECLQPW